MLRRKEQCVQTNSNIPFIPPLPPRLLRSTLAVVPRTFGAYSCHIDFLRYLSAHVRTMIVRASDNYKRSYFKGITCSISCLLPKIILFSYCFVLTILVIQEGEGEEQGFPTRFMQETDTDICRVFLGI